jgi:hypothetical protein
MTVALFYWQKFGLDVASPQILIGIDDVTENCLSIDYDGGLVVDHRLQC